MLMSFSFVCAGVGVSDEAAAVAAADVVALVDPLALAVSCAAKLLAVATTLDCI